MSGQRFLFGGFELIVEQRLLLGGGGQRLRLGSRAFALLVALLQRAGEIVGKEQLIAAAWPGTLVEESSLRVHIAALRKALGDDHAESRLIRNVTGRGYSFVAPVTHAPVIGEGPMAPIREPTPPRRTTPRIVGRILGRDEAVETIAAAVGTHRIVTIAGIGGLGKTTVALQVAAIIGENFADGVVFADLTAAQQDWMVPGVLAAALGQPVNADDVAAGLAELLRDRHLLVILDNCEHVIAAAARLAEALCQASGVTVLATSREILGAVGEWVTYLPGLGVPPADSRTATAAEVLRAPAVALFVERAAARLGGYTLAAEDAFVVAEICRRLDGIALAIELAAGSLEMLGLRGLADSLSDGLGVLTQGRRTALPRHQTLRATLDWSYQLLSPVDRTVFRRLAVFGGPFTADAAEAVAGAADVPEGAVASRLRSLVAKSLVVAEPQGGSPRYRLLAVARAFASELLVAGEREDAARRHAMHVRTLFERAEKTWAARPTESWLADTAAHMAELGVALEWSFAADGGWQSRDREVGVALTVAAVPLWHELSQMDECLRWVRQALAAVEDAPVTHLPWRMQLHAALGFPSMQAAHGLPAAPAAWRTALEIAETLGNTDYQLRALRALWVARNNEGEPRASLALAERFCRLEEETERPEHRIGRRLRGRSLFLLGRPTEAHAEVADMLGRYSPPPQRSHVARFQFDQRVSARITLAPILWVQGHGTRALAEMVQVIDEAIAVGHTLSLINALADGGCPIALLNGDLAVAERFTSLLEDNTRARAFEVWRAYADCFRGALLIRRGQPDAGIELLGPAARALQQAGFVLFHMSFRGALAQGLAALDRIGEAVTIVDEGLRRGAETGEAWFTPELVRIRGLLALRQGDAGAAETFWRRSLAIAGQQGAPAWALRTAHDLALLLRAQDRAAEAAGILAPLHQRLAGDAASPDVAAAAAVLATLAQH